MTTTFGLFNTSIMGMGAQSEALASISENIANSGAVGYKDVTTQFETLLHGFQDSGASGGGVKTRNHYNVDAQGALQDTSSSTDLALKGAGFFVVSNGAGQNFLTRAGSFVPDAEGRLVNAAGFYLKGFATNGNANGAVANDLASMEVIQIHSDKLFASTTTSGALSANLPSDAAIVAAADLPSTNSATAKYSVKTSLTTYDNLGKPVVLDIYFAKTSSNNWEMSVYNAADATTGGFPYSSASLSTQTLSFDPANGNILSGTPASIPIPNGATMTFDLGNTTQLGAKFVVNSSTADGSAPSAVSGIEIGSDGALNYIFDNGKSQSAFRIALARVNSPDNLGNVGGNVYVANGDSGQIFVGTAGAGGFGEIASSALESSTVDLASQLSSLIVAQRSFSANSQVFQVASDVLQILNNLK